MLKRNISKDKIIEEHKKLLEKLANNEINLEEFNKKIVDSGLENRPSLTELVERELLNGIKYQIENEKSYLNNNTNIGARNFGFTIFEDMLKEKNINEGFYKNVAEDFTALEGIRHHDNDELYQFLGEGVFDTKKEYDLNNQKWDDTTELRKYIEYGFSEVFTNLIDKVEDRLEEISFETGKLKKYKFDKDNINSGDLKLIYNILAEQAEEPTLPEKEVIKELQFYSKDENDIKDLIKEEKTKLAIFGLKKDLLTQIYERGIYGKENNPFNLKDTTEELIKMFKNKVPLSNEELFDRYDVQLKELPEFKIFINGEYAYASNAQVNGKDKDGNPLSKEAFIEISQYLEKKNLFLGSDDKTEELLNKLHYAGIDMFKSVRVFYEKENRLTEYSNYNDYIEETVKEKLENEFKETAKIVINEVEKNLTYNDRGKKVLKENEYENLRKVYKEEYAEIFEMDNILEEKLHDIYVDSNFEPEIRRNIKEKEMEL